MVPHHIADRLISNCEIQAMILIIPSDGLWGDGSVYLPHNDYDFEKWIVEDVIDPVKENISEARLSSFTFISGLSMGGYGALRIGAKYVASFRTISAHSSITSLSQMTLFVDEYLDSFYQPDQFDEDVYETIVNSKRHLPHLRFD